MTDRVRDTRRTKGRQAVAIIAPVCLLCAQLLLLLFFGLQKKGFHEDEYYSYYSSNRSAGFSVPDGTWVDTSDLLRELVVEPGEGFRYGLVHRVQSWDVHPPLFYDLLHTVCSLTPGVFSKWQGLTVNLIAFVLCYILLWLLTGQLSLPWPLRLLFQAIWGFHPMTISCVMFLRMYMWLTVWVLACALLHLRLMSQDEAGRDGYLRKRLWIALCAVNFLGFLTHYYYVLFLAGCAIGYGLHLLFFRRQNPMSGRLRMLIHYGGITLLSLLATVPVYPSSIVHILRGYRGREAASSFFDLSNLGLRTGFFLGLLNDGLFGGFLWLILAVIAVLWILSLLSGGKKHSPPLLYLMLAAGVYFLLVSRTALLLGDTSHRYEMPVYPLLLLPVVAGLWQGIMFISGHRKVIATAMVGTVFGLLIVAGLSFRHQVLFLYPEAAARLEQAREAAAQNIPAVVLYRQATPDHVWYLTQELLAYPAVLFQCEDADISTGPELRQADALIAYAADGERREAALQAIAGTGRQITPLWAYQLWTAYELEPAD
ncbi:MAG: hypothetical protein IJT34_02005 [Butyrivibrio sp.]|nr:hypothetical protein [Butyrivibrio sp.]